MSNYNPNDTVFGIKYHIAPIHGGRFYAKKIDWCTEQFGEGSIGRWQDPGPTTWKPTERWYANGDYFWFREEADKMWFLMRWS